MLVVGLDLGTQSCKAVVCDERMAVRGAHAIAYETAYPRPGWAEQDPGVWEAAIGPAIAGAIAEAGVAAEDVAALAVSGQLDGCVAVDARGRVLHPALIWQDRRAVEEAARVDAAELFARTGQVADAGHLAPKAAWLRARLATRPARYHPPTTWIVERLTGETVMDPALASTTMLFDLAARAWAPELLAAWELEARELPRIAEATSVAGVLTAEGARISGLCAATRVAVGTGDDFATPLGAGVVAPDGRAICAIGTAEVVGALAATATLDRAGAEPMVETHAYVGDAYFIENPGWLSGGTLRWVRDLVGIASDAELDAIAATAP
ncbi:MAG: hypothetical protein KIT31_41875, partial [Deltaproteobacteria bacterium]|nr:hypothetical protein [Deltaproteobacteria bacterium]